MDSEQMMEYINTLLRNADYIRSALRVFDQIILYNDIGDDIVSELNIVQLALEAIAAEMEEDAASHERNIKEMDKEDSHGKEV